MTFEVYTYFGRIVSRYTWNSETELHHKAQEQARIACLQYERDHGTQAWVRLKRL